MRRSRLPADYRLPKPDAVKRLLDIITEPDNTIVNMSQAHQRAAAANNCGMFTAKFPEAKPLCNRIHCCGLFIAGALNVGDYIFYFGNNGTEPGIVQDRKRRNNGWHVKINGRWVRMSNCQLQSEWAKENEQ